MNNDSPFHRGEVQVQERAGEREIALRNGRIINRRIPRGAKRFIEKQTYCVLSGTDPNGDIWTTFLAGSAGFADTNTDLDEVYLQWPASTRGQGAVPPLTTLNSGDDIGLLFIELSTRRRLRVNGKFVEHPNGLGVSIEQAYPNCPKYIQRRTVSTTLKSHTDELVREGSELADDHLAWIEGADTFFVGSAQSDGSMDASHRGGRPGFVRVSHGVLRIPDYPGNSMFNTLGNFVSNPHAGLVFIDFDNARQLQLTGAVDLIFDADAADERTGGTGRWWTFRPTRWIDSPLTGAITWGGVEPSPFNPKA